MKKSLFMSLQTLFVSALFMVGCSSSTEDIIELDTPKEEKDIQVSIGFSGEILNITESPLSRGEEGTEVVKNWYAFQVYSKPKSSTDEGGTEEGGTEEGYSYYAYGFFDNTDNLKINLKEGYLYKFDVCMVVNGSEKVKYFSLVNAGWASIGNSFYISSQEHVRDMYKGYLYLQNPNNTFNRPNVDRFFGRFEDYEPSEEGSVTIDMKRVSFGVKFAPQGFNEGSLEISVEGAPILELAAGEGTEIEEAISFNNLEKAYTEDNYSENIPVNITWVKEDGARVPIASEPVSFKRNIKTTINFEVKDSSSNNNFDINTNEQWGTEETVNIGGEGTNTEVNPEN